MTDQPTKTIQARLRGGPADGDLLTLTEEAGELTQLRIPRRGGCCGDPGGGHDVYGRQPGAPTPAGETVFNYQGAGQ